MNNQHSLVFEDVRFQPKQVRLALEGDADGLIEAFAWSDDKLGLDFWERQFIRLRRRKALAKKAAKRLEKMLAGGVRP